MAHIEFERASFDGLKLYFQGWETEQNLRGIICLVHGLGEHSGRYSYWAELLNQAGYTVLAYDLRGHGKSGGMRGHINSFDEYLKDTDILLNEANNRFTLQPCFIYGHSLGAIIVCSYILHRKPQINGAVISALSVKTALQEQKGKVLLAKVIGQLIPKFTMGSGLVPETISRDPAIVSKYVNDPMVHKQVTAGFGRGSINEIDWIKQHASDWSLPVLFMHGELDKLGYMDGTTEFASKIKNDCTVKIWPGMYHELHNEPEKELVFEYLRGWLDQHSHPV